MKILKILCFCLIALMLYPAIGLSEDNPALESMSPETIAQRYWNADSGLDDFYNTLEQTHGAFRYWSPERKHWFTSMLPTLKELEAQRIETYHPEWINASVLWLDRLLVHRYGLPDENSLSEETAKAKAIEWVIAHQLLSADDIASGRISSNFYCDDPSQPMWVFKFYQYGGKRAAETWMTGSDGVFAQCNAVDIEDIAKQYLLSTQPMVAGKMFTSHNMEYCYIDSFFDPKTSTWAIQIIVPDNNCGWTVQIEDTTRQIVDMEAWNG